MELNELVKQAHETAKEKGWWEKPRSPLEIHALIHSEISEATEAARVAGIYGESEELVDAIIRIADYFGHRGWDLQACLQRKMEFNKTRSYRHGDKVY